MARIKRAMEMTSGEFEKAVEEGRVFIVPLGSLEEHGSHLPLGTDMYQPEALLDELAERTGAVIMPSMAYGVCNTTAPFPGTVSLSFDTIRTFARDVTAGLAGQGVRRIMFLTGHAGSSHVAAIKQGVRDALEGKDPNMFDVRVLSDYDFAYARKDLPPDDGHGGMLETSRMLAIRPDLVREDRPVGHPRYPRFRVPLDGRRYLAEGIHGDTAGASAEYGEKVNRAILEELVMLIEEMKGGSP